MNSENNVIDNVETIMEKTKMKKITMLVPDIMIYVGNNLKENVDVDTKTMELALTRNDYHINYFFPENSIKVISVDEHP